MKKHFNKKRLMAKEDDKDFKNLSKCWICDHICVKVGISTSKEICLICFNVSPLNDENFFLFHLQSFFCYEDI